MTPTVTSRLPGPSTFTSRRWERAAARVAGRAVREVPFYRERSTPGTLPDPVPSAELAERTASLCPLISKFDPAEEPSLWTGVPGDLAAAVRSTGVSRFTPVIEIRRQWIDRSSLGRLGPVYAAALAPGAAEPSRLSALDERARLLTGAVLLGAPAELDAVAARIGHSGPVIARLTAAEAASWTGGPAVVYDRHLGYYAALAQCGRWHVSWQRFHVLMSAEGPQVTALRRTRPTLLRVIPEEPGFTSVTACPAHDTPVLS